MALLPSAVTPPPAASPLPVPVLCSNCPTTDDRPSPPGWVIVSQVRGDQAGPRFGICPACLAAEYEFSVRDAGRGR